MSYNSKYSGKQVENLLDQVASSQFITADELDTALNDKVDKVSGKQLSTEDFTSTLKSKLEGLSNYDDTTISNAISGLQSQINALVGDNASTAIESFNEVIAFLDGIQDTQDLSSIVASIEQQIAEKMDKVTLAKVATSGSYNDLTDKPTILQGEKGDKGDTGATGPAGEDGKDGVSITSVVQTTTSTADGGNNVVTVTLSDGKTSTFTVKNGSKGNQGPQGPAGANGAKGDKGDKGDTGPAGSNGTNGATFTPSVDSAGNLSWTNNGGLSNPPTVNIKGPKGDSGEGGSGGDSSIFITHFSVDEFISGSAVFTDEQEEAFIDAARQNKIIALPSSPYDGYKGFLVSSYSYFEGEDGYWSMALTIVHGSVSYTGLMYNNSPYFGLASFTIIPFLPLVEYISVAEDGSAIVDSFNKDNLIVIIEGECRYLIVGDVGPQYGMTVRFYTGEDCAIEYWGYWANGEIPTIEPYTTYEMSVVYGADSFLCAVLTPFKFVEQ